MSFSFNGRNILPEETQDTGAHIFQFTKEYYVNQLL